MNVDWGAVFQAGGQVAGAIAATQAAKAKGREAEARTSNNYDVGTLDRYATDKELDLRALVDQYRAELDRSKGVIDEYETRLAAPQQRASNAVRGSILANVQDVGVSAPAGVNVTSFSGGLRPSILDANTRALGGQMSKEALLSALADDAPRSFSSMKPFDVTPITSRRAPGQTPMQEPSGMDKVLENIAMWGGLAGVGAKAFAPSPTAAGTLAAGPPPVRPTW